MPQAPVHSTHLLSLAEKRTTSAPEHSDEEVNSLPVDALRACFQRLECRSLGRCSCVSTAWCTAASGPDLWWQQLRFNYYRPAMLPYYFQLPKPLIAARNQDAHVACNLLGAPAASSDAPQKRGDLSKLNVESACKDGAAAATGSSGVPTSPKKLFGYAVVHPAAQHQALLARFQSAMAQIQGWRLLIKRTSPASPQTTAGDTAGAEQHRVQCIANGAPQVQQQPNNDSYPDAATSSNSIRGSQGMLGHPQPLTWSALKSGAAWAIGCVQQQRQEQSCWLRFNLPPELKLDEDLEEAAVNKQLTATVQALGPGSVGWFDVITCTPFLIEEEDVDILYQSHKTGFYAWDHSAEDGMDTTAEADPMPWDIPAGGDAQAATLQGTTSLGSQLATAAVQQQQQQQADTAFVQLEQQCKLRMLVYIHYEQLLKMLPLQLAQALPTAQQWYRQSKSIQAAAQQLVLHSNAALWLHMDICQLNGGFRLGSCVAPLKVALTGAFGVQFQAQQERVLAALYDPRCSMNCSGGGITAQHVGSSPEKQSSIPGTATVAEPSAQVLMEAGCELMVIGSRLLHGRQKVGSRGVLLTSAAEVMRELMSMDEVMVDFALFDAEGRLLMGRAGVEIWSKEETSAYNAPLAVHPLPAAQQLVADQQQQEGAEPPPLPAAAAGPLADNAGVHTRTIQLLHFMVDNVQSSLWDAAITVDAAPAPDGLLRIRNVPLLALKLTWSTLKGLFGDVEQQQQQKPHWQRSPEDALEDLDVVEAMQLMWSGKS